MANTYLEMQLDAAAQWGFPCAEAEFATRVGNGEDIMGLDNSILSGLLEMAAIGGSDHDPRGVLDALKAGNNSPLLEIGASMRASGTSDADATYQVGAAVHTGWIAENLYRMDAKIERGQGGQYAQFCNIGTEEQAKDVKIMTPILEAAGIDTKGWETVAATAAPEPMRDFVDQVALLAPAYKNYEPQQITAFAAYNGVKLEPMEAKDARVILDKSTASADEIVQRMDSNAVRGNPQAVVNVGTPADTIQKPLRPTMADAGALLNHEPTAALAEEEGEDPAGTPEEWAMEAWNEAPEPSGRMQMGTPFHMERDPAAKGDAKTTAEGTLGIIGENLQGLVQDAKIMDFLALPLGDVIGLVGQMAAEAKEDAAKDAADAKATDDAGDNLDNGDLSDIDQFPDFAENEQLDEGGWDNSMDGDWEDAQDDE